MDLGQRAVDVGEAAAGRGQEEILDPLVVRREDAHRRGEGDGVEHGLLVGELVEELLPLLEAGVAVLRAHVHVCVLQVERLVRLEDLDVPGCG